MAITHHVVVNMRSHNYEIDDITLYELQADRTRPPSGAEIGTYELNTNRLNGIYNPDATDLMDAAADVHSGTTSLIYQFNGSKSTEVSLSEIETNTEYAKVFGGALVHDPIYKEVQRLRDEAAKQAAKDAYEQSTQTFIYYKCDSAATQLPMSLIPAATFQELFDQLDTLGWCDNEAKAILTFIDANPTETTIPPIERVVVATSYDAVAAPTPFSAEVTRVNDRLSDLEVCIPLTQK